jgi:adenine phosphoribosyltransferase
MAFFSSLLYSVFLWCIDMVNGEFFDLKEHIRSIPGWPEPHVTFRDICSLLEDKYFFRKSIDLFIHRYFNTKIDAVVGIDARGFIIGAPVAYELNAGFIPVRKKGKLPGETISESYTLEYGSDEIEIQATSLHQGDRVILIDDLIATGGTMLAASNLLKKLGVEIVEAAAIIDLPDLGGSKILRESGLMVHTFCEFEGD